MKTKSPKTPKEKKVKEKKLRKNKPLKEKTGKKTGLAKTIIIIVLAVALVGESAAFAVSKLNSGKATNQIGNFRTKFTFIKIFFCKFTFTYKLTTKRKSFSSNAVPNF